MKSVVLALRFMTELALLAGALWAGGAVSWVVGGLAAVAVAAIWGAAVAPKAARRAPDPLRLGLEVVLFGLVSIGLALAGHPRAGAALVVLGVSLAVAVRRVAPGA